MAYSNGIPRAASTPLEAAVSVAASGLAEGEPGRLVSLSLPLSAELEGSVIAAASDSRWLAPHERLRIYADGAAVRFDSDAARQFDQACAGWQLLGPESGPPLAFFTVPAATVSGQPRLWVPRVVVREQGGAAVLTLTARREAGPPALIVETWLAEIRRLFARATPACPPPLRLLSVAADPDSAAWLRRVEQAAQAIADGRLAKVVLARRLSALLSRPADPARMTNALARVHPECRAFSLPHGPGFVVAASPELLAVKRGRRLVSHALAGTARRHDDPEADAAAAAVLMASAKERREHAIVVDAIAGHLDGLCEAVEPLPEPTVMRLRFLQHLWTPIAGRLRSGVGLIEAVSRLHPTPAVLGSPTRAAIDWLTALGERRDGLYTGVVGWIDRDGDGDAAVVLRAAYLEARRAVLWAGAGIMAESDAEAELAETEMKLASMLEVLNAP